MLKSLNTPQFALMVFLAFVCLAAYSWQWGSKRYQTGYKHSSFSVLDRMPQQRVDGLNAVWDSIPTAALSVKLPEDMRE